MSELAVASLSKSFGAVRAVDDVSFAVARGEFLALIGPNGAGKSTCFNIINGQIKPDGGTIRFEDRDIAGLPPREICRRGIARTFQIAATFSSMTVAENVQMALIAHARETYGLWRRAASYHRGRALELLRQVGMEEAADRPSRELAYGSGSPDVTLASGCDGLRLRSPAIRACCSWTSRPRAWRRASATT